MYFSTQLLNIPLYHVHSHSAAGNAGGRFGGRKTGRKDKRIEVFVAKFAVLANNSTLNSLFSNFIGTQASAVILYPDKHICTGVLRTDIYCSTAGFAGFLALL